jgi:hypothetical protein
VISQAFTTCSCHVVTGFIRSSAVPNGSRDITIADNLDHDVFFPVDWLSSFHIMLLSYLAGNGIT